MRFPVKGNHSAGRARQQPEAWGQALPSQNGGGLPAGSAQGKALLPSVLPLPLPSPPWHSQAAALPISPGSSPHLAAGVPPFTWRQVRGALSCGAEFSRALAGPLTAPAPAPIPLVRSSVNPTRLARLLPRPAQGTEPPPRDDPRPPSPAVLALPTPWSFLKST